MISQTRLTLAASLAALALAAPAAAQDEEQRNERINMVIAYSEDECPTASQPGEIVVCEILVEAERYRIPSNLRNSDSPENVSRVRQVDKIRYVGEFGTMSCSPVGAGGITGCNQQMIQAAYADRSEAESVRFSQLIEEARQERLSTIDADAAAEQERVEQIEREYLQRLERERDAPIPGEENPSLTPPPIDTEERQPPVEPSKPGPFAEDDEVQVPLDAIPPPAPDGGN
jgi:hypothetical protein